VTAINGLTYQVVAGHLTIRSERRIKAL